MNVVAFLIAIALFIGGLFLMGYSFYVEGLEILMFLGGILAVSLSIALPVHILKRIDA